MPKLQTPSTLNIINFNSNHLIELPKITQELLPELICFRCSENHINNIDDNELLFIQNIDTSNQTQLKLYLPPLII